MNSKILVTGATGKVGSQVIKQLSEAGHAVRAGTRDPSKAEHIQGQRVEIVPLDFDNRASIAKALEGIERLCLITPPHFKQVDWAVLVTDLAKQAGVKHLVRLSVLAAKMEPGIQLGRWHRTVERYIQASGVDWTIVRPSPFMQNFLGMYPSHEGQYRLPVGDAEVCHIDVLDVATVLSLALTEPGHEGKIHTITGAQPLTMAQAIDLLDAGSDQSPAFTDVPESETREAMLTAGRPPWLVDILMELFAAFRTGAVGVTLPTFQELTGKPPRDFGAFASQTR